MFLSFSFSTSSSADFLAFFVLCLYCLHLSLLSIFGLPGDDVMESWSLLIEEDGE